jgi:hypothetical protein
MAFFAPAACPRPGLPFTLRRPALRMARLRREMRDSWLGPSG